jgi:hypothetical protein
MSSLSELQSSVLHALESNGWNQQVAFKLLQSKFSNKDILNEMRLCTRNRASAMSTPNSDSIVSAKHSTQNDIGADSTTQLQNEIKVGEEDAPAAEFMKLLGSSNEALSGYKIRGLNPLMLVLQYI